MIKLMEPIGYCFGVKNSISSVIQAKKKHPKAKIVFLKPLVHNATTNKLVMNELKAEVYSPDKPISFYKDSLFAFPAHGYTHREVLLIKSLQADYVDCTCPLLIVNKNTMRGNIKSGFQVILLGKKNHPEVLSILDEMPSIKFVSVDDIDTFDYSSLEKYPKLAIYPQSTIGQAEFESFLDKAKSHIKGKLVKGSICRECLKRWNSLIKLDAENYSTIIIVGDKDSSNSNEFLNLAKKNKPDSFCFMAETKNDLAPFLKKIKFDKDIFIFSSTSTSEKMVYEIYKKLKTEERKYRLSAPLRDLKKLFQG